jgi:branched-chain amino acid transport system substrate-binding protein
MVGRRRTRRARILAAQSLIVVLSACSVSTPRDGVLGLDPAGSGSQVSTVPGQLGVGTSSVDSGTAGAPVNTPLGSGPVSGSSAAGSISGTTATGTRAGQSGSTTGSGTSGSTGTAVAPGGPVPGVTSKEIRFSVLAGFTGLYGQILEGVVDNGFGTWVDDINAHGGLFGRRVVMVKVDNKDTAEGGISGCKEIQGNNSYFAFSLVGFGGADVSATDCLDKAGIPTISYLVSAYNNRWRNVYTVSEPAVTSRPLASFIQHILNKGNTKIGLFVEKDPLFLAGAQGFLDGMKTAGLKVVHTETVATNQSSFVSEVSRMRSAGVETVVMIVAGTNGIGIPRDAKSIGWSPTFTGALFDHDEFSKAAAAIQSGIQGIRYYASTNSPGYAKFVVTADKYGHGTNATALTASVYGLGLLVQQILQYDGASPTRASFGPAVERVVNYNNGILGVSFGKGVHRADGLQFPVKCCNSDNTWMGTGAPKSLF